MGVFLERQTSKSLIVCGSTPFDESIIIKAQSTAVKTLYVSSEKSLCPGVSNKFKIQFLYSNCMTELATEIPLSFSIAIQSDVANFLLFLAFTVPAS